MRTLYELRAQLAQLEDAIEAGEIPPEAIADTLDCVEGEFNEKVENIACLIKNLSADVTALKAEKAAISDRIKYKTNKVEALKNYLEQQLTQAGIKKVDMPKAVVSIGISHPLEIADEAAFCEKYPLYTKVTKEPMKAAITKAIKEGTTFEGAALTDKENLRVK